jgi:hypothetical protein
VDVLVVIELLAIVVGRALRDVVKREVSRTHGESRQHGRRRTRDGMGPDPPGA